MEQLEHQLRITLDQILDEADRIAAAYGATEEELHQEIMRRSPRFSAADVARYSNYASAARCIAGALRKTAMQSAP